MTTQTLATVDIDHIDYIEHKSTTDNIELKVAYANKAIEKYTIEHEQFSEWLEESGYLDWICDHSNHSGEHQQVSGTYGYVEYLEHVITDEIIIEFINYRTTSGRGMKIDFYG